MISAKKTNLLTFIVLFIFIAIIFSVLVYFTVKQDPDRPSRLAVLYNAGLGADYERFLSDSSYSYDEMVLSAYDFFKGKTEEMPPIFSNIKTHSLDESKLFSTNSSVEKFAPNSSRKEIKNLKKDIEKIVFNSPSLLNQTEEFKTKLIETIYRALVDFSEARVKLRIANKVITIDLSKTDLELVTAIMLVESAMNPFALTEEPSLDSGFSSTVYSRGLMQIYEMTLWTLNSWLKESDCNVKPDDLWSIRTNIFLGMVYINYANYILENS